MHNKCPLGIETPGDSSSLCAQPSIPVIGVKLANYISGEAEPLSVSTDPNFWSKL